MAIYGMQIDGLSNKDIEEQALVLGHLLINKLLESENNEIEISKLTPELLDDYEILFETENVYPNCTTKIKLMKSGKIVNNERLPEFTSFIQDILTRRVTLIKK